MNPSLTSPSLLALCAAAVAGCAPSFQTAQEQLTFRIEAEAGSPGDPFEIGDPVVVGSTLCPRWDNEELAACFTQSVEGPASLDQGCVRVEGAGEITWRLSPTTCSVEEPPSAEDSVTFPAVSADDLTATLQPWPELYATVGLHPGDAGAFPDDWLPAAEAPLLIAAGQPFHALALLRQGDQPALWSPDTASLEVEAVSGEPAQASLHEASWPGEIQLSLPAGAESRLWLQLGDGRWDLGTVRGVATADITSLEVVVAHLDADGEVGPPVGARAVARDSSGAPVFGAPIEWSVTGGIASLPPADYLPGADYRLVNDECVDPEFNHGRRSVQVTATLGELDAQGRFSWQQEQQELNPDWSRSDHCEGPGRACGGCSAASRPASAGLALVLPVLAAGRRRR